MNQKLSIIYAHRNRDPERIKISFNSLKNQELQNFEVMFVDYGSEERLVTNLVKIAKDFSFVQFHHLPVPQLLWNKSKALNYGIIKASGDYIFIADIDLVFHPDATQFLQEIITPNKFNLFKLGYLDDTESRKLQSEYQFNDLKPFRFGEINGMVLASRESLQQINGLDEFYHFYGAEDEDLFARLENAGYHKEYRTEKYFYHQCHQSFSGSEDRLLTENPRVKYIMRINQRHFQFNRENGILKPLRQQSMGNFISSERAKALRKVDIELEIPNILAKVEHFLREELPSRKGKVVQAEFYEDEYYKSSKYKLKSILGKPSQPYISLKRVNDMVLKEILYNYRDHNYSFSLGKDLKSIIFCIEV